VLERKLEIKLSVPTK